MVKGYLENTNTDVDIINMVFRLSEPHTHNLKCKFRFTLYLTAVSKHVEEDIMKIQIFEFYCNTSVKEGEKI